MSRTLKDFVYISPAYEAVVEHERYIECGSGPEQARAGKFDNPNWLRNRAANCIALAEWIETAEQRKAAGEDQLAKRRDELARDLVEDPRISYAGLSNGAQHFIDRFIELERAS